MRELFFREFVTSLIMNSMPQVHEAPIQPIQQTPLIQQPQFQTQAPPLQVTPAPLIRPFSSQIMPRVPVYNMPASPLPASQQLALPSMTKLNFLVADASITSIECPGPNKPVLINRGGFIQATNIMLTKMEIDSIIQELSEKTRIPLIQGTFKAAFGQLLVTAVISEFVGTRFIIQKRLIGQ